MDKERKTYNNIIISITIQRKFIAFLLKSFKNVIYIDINFHNIVTP